MSSPTLKPVGLRLRFAAPAPARCPPANARRRARDWRRTWPRALGDHRVEPRHIRWRPHIEQLTGDEADARGAFRRHAAHRARRLLPPEFLREESLLPQHVREPLPGWVVETPVACLRLEGWLCLLDLTSGGEAGQARADAGALDAELEEPAGRICKMRSPVEPGVVERMRRDALGEPRSTARPTRSMVSKEGVPCVSALVARRIARFGSALRLLRGRFRSFDLGGTD